MDDTSETAKTNQWLRAVYFGEPVPPYPADKPIPQPRVPSADETRRVTPVRK